MEMQYVLLIVGIGVFIVGAISGGIIYLKTEGENKNKRGLFSAIAYFIAAILMFVSIPTTFAAVVWIIIELIKNHVI